MIAIFTRDDLRKPYREMPTHLVKQFMLKKTALIFSSEAAQSYFFGSASEPGRLFMETTTDPTMDHIRTRLQILGFGRLGSNESRQLAERIAKSFTGVERLFAEELLDVKN
jgi:hypothetical protein